MTAYIGLDDDWRLWLTQHRNTAKQPQHCSATGTGMGTPQATDSGVALHHQGIREGDRNGPYLVGAADLAAQPHTGGFSHMTVHTKAERQAFGALITTSVPAQPASAAHTQAGSLVPQRWTRCPVHPDQQLQR